MNKQTTTSYDSAAWNEPHSGQPWYPPVQRTSVQSYVVLGLGVASLTVLWGLAGIVALVLAPNARREIAASGGTLGGEGLIRAGVICSWISIALTVLAILLAIALLLALSGGGGVDTYVEVGPIRAS